MLYYVYKGKPISVASLARDRVDENKQKWEKVFYQLGTEAKMSFLETCLTLPSHVRQTFTKYIYFFKLERNDLNFSKLVLNSQH